MSAILIAPTEPPAIKRLGASSPVPEAWGVDILWHAKPIGMVGVQRKELGDFISSMTDGRLSKEVAQMQRLDLAGLIVEGRARWTRDGELFDAYKKVNRQQLRGFLWTIRSKGVWVETTDSVSDTIQTVQWWKAWTEKGRHDALASRSGPRKSEWGHVSAESYAIHLLTSFPSVGPKTAENLIAHFGGVPLSWDVTEQELMEVDGIGKVTARRLVRALQTREETPDAA